MLEVIFLYTQFLKCYIENCRKIGVENSTIKNSRRVIWYLHFANCSEIVVSEGNFFYMLPELPTKSKCMSVVLFTADFNQIVKLF